MIKFFRQIRQTLLSENKFSKYLLYAFGEIVLVVIGILIALQINNWNEETKERNKEVTYLKNIQRDLKDQLNSIDEQIASESSFVNTAAYLMNAYKEDTFKNIDSDFFSKLTDLQSRKTFLIIDPTYTDLLSSGNIDIIRNSDFKDQLIKYYQDLERREKIIQNNNSLLVDQQFASVFVRLGYYFNQEGIGQYNYMNRNSSSLPLGYKDKLADTSKKILHRPENALQLMNIIGLRHVTALSSLNSMRSSREATSVLLSKVNTIVDD